MSSNAPERPRNRPPLSLDRRKDVTGKTVVLLVGPDEQEVPVHEAMLREASAFFNKAMSPAWKDTRSNIIKLPEDEPDVVKLYVHWIYLEEIAAPPLSNVSLMVYDLNVVQAWVFGEKILDKNFRNAIVHGIFKRINTKEDDNRSWIISPDAVKYAYEHTMKGASMRRSFVDLYCQSSHEVLMPLWEDEDIPFDFVLELAKELVKRTLSRKPCTYRTICELIIRTKRKG